MKRLVHTTTTTILTKQHEEVSYVLLFGAHYGYWHAILNSMAMAMAVVTAMPPCLTPKTTRQRGAKESVTQKHVE